MRGHGLLLLSALFLMSFSDTIIVERAPEPKRDRGEFGTRPPDCGNYYDTDNHEQWAECMGVGYKNEVMKHD